LDEYWSEGGASKLQQRKVHLPRPSDFTATFPPPSLLSLSLSLSLSHTHTRASVIISSRPAMLVEHNLPFQRNLLITTPNTIHVFSQNGDRILFECEATDGIVNAHAAPDNSSLLAIASRQIILLHDTIHSREKQHKLEGEGVSVLSAKFHVRFLLWL
jgi:hypothetical protein